MLWRYIGDASESSRIDSLAPANLVSRAELMLFARFPHLREASSACDTEKSSTSSRSRRPNLRSIGPFVPRHDIARGVFQAVQAALGFAFMLAVMYVPTVAQIRSPSHLPYFVLSPQVVSSCLLHCDCNWDGCGGGTVRAICKPCITCTLNTVTLHIIDIASHDDVPVGPWQELASAAEPSEDQE